MREWNTLYLVNINRFYYCIYSYRYLKKKPQSIIAIDFPFTHQVLQKTLDNSST